MNPATIEEIIALIGLAGQAGLELYLKLKAIGELGPDEQTNIHNQIAAGIAFDEDVKKKYAQWRIEVGLDTAPQDAAATAEPDMVDNETMNKIEDEAQEEAQQKAATPAPVAPPPAKASTVHDPSSTIPPGA